MSPMPSSCQHLCPLSCGHPICVVLLTFFQFTVFKLNGVRVLPQLHAVQEWNWLFSTLPTAKFPFLIGSAQEILWIVVCCAQLLFVDDILHARSRNFSRGWASTWLKQAIAKAIGRFANPRLLPVMTSMIPCTAIWNVNWPKHWHWLAVCVAVVGHLNAYMYTRTHNF